MSLRQSYTYCSSHIRTSDFPQQVNGMWRMMLIQLFRENVHVTIPKGDMGYDQYTVPDTGVEPTIVAFF